MPSTYNLAVPDQGASPEIRTRTKKMSFGDGYEQRSGDGLNSVKEIWSLNWSGRTKAEIEAICNFLAAELGVTYFLWTSPRGTQIKVKCESWKPSYNHDFDCSLTATFEQVFAL